MNPRMDRLHRRGLRYHAGEGKAVADVEAGHFRAIKTWAPGETETVVLKKGELVRCLREEDGDSGWLRCEKGGKMGGVPAELIEPEGAAMGRLKEDYSSQELWLSIGDEVEGLMAVGGWLWGRKLKTGETGWCPADAVKEVRTISI